MLSNNQILGLVFLGVLIFWFGYFIKGFRDIMKEERRQEKMLREQEKQNPKASRLNGQAKILSCRKAYVTKDH